MSENKQAKPVAFVDANGDLIAKTKLEPWTNLYTHPAQPVQPVEPVEFDYPDFHAQGMGCGLEDRGITNRYEAMRYGWEKALDKMAEMLEGIGPVYTHPPADVVRQMKETLWQVQASDAFDYMPLELQKAVVEAYGVAKEHGL